jgi:hypothetical protein
VRLVRLKERFLIAQDRLQINRAIPIPGIPEKLIPPISTFNFKGWLTTELSSSEKMKDYPKT